MSINIHIGERGEVFVAATIIIQELKITEPLTFLIDTGASESSLAYADRVKFGVDIKNLPKSSKSTITLGGRVDIYDAPRTALFFTGTDGQTVHCVLDKIGVIGDPPKESKKHTQKKAIREKRHIQSLKMIPSLLGRDVLNDKQSTIHIDWKKRKGNLHIHLQD